MSVASLEDGTLLCILHYLDAPQLSQAREVCRRWARVGECDDLWEALCHVDFGVVAKPPTTPSWHVWYHTVRSPGQAISPAPSSSSSTPSSTPSTASASSSPGPEELWAVVRSQGQRLAEMDMHYATALGTIRHLDQLLGDKLQTSPPTVHRTPPPRETREMYEEERATFVDATYDEEFVTRRLSTSPSAAAVLSPCHPNKPIPLQGSRRKLPSKAARKSPASDLHSPGRTTSLPPPHTPPSLPSRCPSLSRLCTPPCRRKSPVRTPPQRPAVVDGDNELCRTDPEDVVVVEEEQMPQEVQHHQPQPPPVQHKQRQPQQQPQKQHQQHQQLQQPMSAAIERVIEKMSRISLEPRSYDTDADIMHHHSEVLSAYLPMFPSPVVESITRLQRINNSLRSMYANQLAATMAKASQLEDEQRKNQELIARSIALSTRLDESKKCVKKLKKTIAEAKQQNLPLHNQLLQARIEEDKKYECEFNQLKQQAGQFLAQQNSLMAELEQRTLRINALERLLDDMEQQHKKDLVSAVSLNWTVPDQDIAKENAALRVSLDGAIQALHQCYHENQTLHEELLLRIKVEKESERQRQEANQLCQDLLAEREEQRHAWDVAEKNYMVQIAYLQKLLQERENSPPVPASSAPTPAEKHADPSAMQLVSPRLPAQLLADQGDSGARAAPSSAPEGGVQYGPAATPSAS